MSSIFQRPLCEMGAAYDFAFRPVLGPPEPGFGGPCDDRPHAVKLYGTSEPGAERTPRTFALCPEHEDQLRRMDAKAAGPTEGSRFPPPSSPGRR